MQRMRTVVAIKCWVAGCQFVCQHNDCCGFAITGITQPPFLLVSSSFAWKGGWTEGLALSWRHDAHPREDKAVLTVELMEIQVFFAKPDRQLVKRDTRKLSYNMCAPIATVDNIQKQNSRHQTDVRYTHKKQQTTSIVCMCMCVRAFVMWQMQ